MIDLLFFIEVLVGGYWSAGVMYALVAPARAHLQGIVGIQFRAGRDGVLRRPVLRGVHGTGLPFWAALPVTVGLMVLVGMATERFVLRPLVNQNEHTLLMATIGLAFVIEGTAQLAWGVDVRRLDLGIRDEPIGWLADQVGILVSQLDITAGIVAGIMVAALALLFSRTRSAVACVQWRMTTPPRSRSAYAKAYLDACLGHCGRRGAGAGMLWGARSGVQFALIGVALKALPVLIIGGFTSVPGVIIAGLIVGAIEKVVEVFIGPYFGGGIEGWSPYMLAVLFRPARGSVRRKNHPARLMRRQPGDCSMIYGEAGQFRTSYAQDSQLLPLRQDRLGMAS